MSKVKYPSLNGLRAISVTLVIFHHLGLIHHIFDGLSGIIWLRPFTDFLQDGQFGVNVFFVISGFLITSLLLNEEAKTKTISLKNFYIRRTLRIFPAYYFLLIVYAVLQLMHIIYIKYTAWITAIAYMKYFNWETDWFTGHAWSLSIEEHFYLFWPLVFLRFKKVRKQVVMALILLVPVLRIAMVLFTKDNADIILKYDLTIFTRIDSIATGCLFALYQKEIVKKLSPYWRPLFYTSAILLFFLRYFPMLAAKVHLAFIFIPFGWSQNGAAHDITGITHATIANLLIAIIIMYSIFGPEKWWYKIMNSKPLNYIGLLSYSIYLWQELFTSRLAYWPMNVPQNVLCIAAMALFSYYVIEQPFLKLKSKFFEPKV